MAQIIAQLPNPLRAARRRRGAAIGVPLMALLWLTPPAAAAPAWRDTPLNRLAALALIESLSADLLDNRSATLVLDQWCARHQLASPAIIVADRINTSETAPDAAQRALLGVSPTEPVRHRRVALRCGSATLSIADNWYVPARLTPEMNHALDHSNIAFGRVVAPLAVLRTSLGTKLLWDPLPANWAQGAPIPRARHGALAIPEALLEHRALLTRGDGAAISLVIERYQRALLGFAPPRVAR